MIDFHSWTTQESILLFNNDSVYGDFAVRITVARWYMTDHSNYNQSLKIHMHNITKKTND